MSARLWFWLCQLSVVILDLYKRLFFLHKTRRGPSIARFLSDTLGFSSVLINHQDLSTLFLLWINLLMTEIIYTAVCYYFSEYLIRLVHKIICLPASWLERFFIIQIIGTFIMLKMFLSSRLYNCSNISIVTLSSSMLGKIPTWILFRLKVSCLCR